MSGHGSDNGSPAGNADQHSHIDGSTSDLLGDTYHLGDGNDDLEVKQNFAPIAAEIYLPPDQPETLPTPSSTIPFRRDLDFVGRQTLLDQLHQRCSVPAARTALFGLGGIGKSQLAIEYSYQVRDQSPETWVFWVNASNAARFEQSCREIADHVKISGRRDPRADILKLVHNWLRDERNGKWLLILDNADDARWLLETHTPNSVAPASGSYDWPTRPLWEYLPLSQHGSVLITTRRKDVALKLVEEHDIIAVKQMDKAHAAALFERELLTQSDQEDTSELVVALDLIPLAIVQAAMYINQRPGCSIREYIEKFRESDRNKMNLLTHEAGHPRRERDAKNSIIMTWRISFHHIRRERPSAANLLSLMSFCYRQGIPKSLLRNRGEIGNRYRDLGNPDSNKERRSNEVSRSEISVTNEFEDDILMLKNYSFIFVNIDNTTFGMHRLVQLATQKWLEDHGQLERWKQQYIRNLCAEFPTGKYENWAKCEVLFPHAQLALAQQPEGGDSLREWALLLYNAAWYACLRGNLSDAEKMSVESMKVRKEQLGHADRETLSSQAMVALAYKLRGRWKEAEELEVQVMCMSKRLLGEEHPDTLTSMANLALTYWNQGRLAEAQALTMQVLESRKWILGEEHPDTLRSMDSLASTYWNQGRLAEAQALDVQVLESRKRILGEEHPNTLRSMNNLASTYRNQGRWKEAEVLGVQGMETSLRVLGQEHPDTLTSMANLASTYRGQERWREAEELNVQELESRKRMLGEEHPDTLTSMDSLALTFLNQDRLNDAEMLEAHVIEISKKVLGEGHPSTLNGMNNLAITWKRQGRDAEALKLVEECEQLRKRIKGSNALVFGSTDGMVRLWVVSMGVWKHAQENQFIDQHKANESKDSHTAKATSQPPPNEQVEHAPTDSGFASRAQGKSAQTYSSSEKEVKVITEVTKCTQDSAFVGSQWGADEQDVQDVGLDTAETIYSASEASILRGEYITELAAELFGTIKSFKPDRGILEHISEMLPDLLRAFALKLGHKAQTPMYLDVSLFIHKYRTRIQIAFEDMFLIASSNIEKVQPRQFAISRYLEEPNCNIFLQPIMQDENNNYRDDEPEPTPEIHDDFDSAPASLEQNENSNAFEDGTKSAPNTGLYHGFITETPAYSWLVASLQREMTLTRANPDLMEDIRRNILSALPSFHIVSRKTLSKVYKATFELDWDPISFVKEQLYTESPDEALEKVITITGSMDDAQAMTPGEYLSQTWPATGKSVMRLVTDVVRNTTDRYVTSNLPDGTELGVRIDGSKLIVTASGTGDSLAEIGQQFAWLGAALRSSRLEAEVAACSPFIRSTRLETSVSPAQASKPMPFVEIFCVIDFEINEPATNAGGASGQCWHNMFRNPVMVSGYPILTKHEHRLGLEIPLNMIAGLAGSERANIFDGKVFIKGFSTMLVATKITRDLLIWHYYYNSEGERISYLDHMLQGIDDISLLQLDTARHVVGWCSDCMYNAGAVDAGYNILGTGLPRPHAGCVLEKVSVSGGKIITGGVTFAVAVKDSPQHLTRDGYIPKLRWIATKYVVMWDEADKRGWLVNGISALLHLVRASLEHYSTDDFSSSFLFDRSKMKDAAEHKPNSATKVLADIDNKELEIYPGKSERFEEEVKRTGSDAESKTRKKKRGYYLFEDLVEQHYNILEQIMDHHRHVAGQNGVKLKTRVRKHLEGWDFVELATDHDPYPRVATLQALGYGWVDFIRSIDAITLFGCGFGDIIRPIEFKGMCPNWRRLPLQKYYLAASVFDLKTIMKRFGDARAGSLKPVHDLLWHCPGDLVAPCPCQGRGTRQIIHGAFRQHCDPVQIFYPRLSRLFLPIRGPDRLEDGGAVVFGHNVAWGYHWKENGHEDLEKGDPPILLPVPKHQIMTVRTGPNSSNQETSLSTASRSSQNRETTTGTMTHSSPSPYSAHSTPDESVVDSAQVLTLDKPKQAYNTPGSSQQISGENKTRTLRRERRRL